MKLSSAILVISTRLPSLRTCLKGNQPVDCPQANAKHLGCIMFADSDRPASGFVHYCVGCHFPFPPNPSCLCLAGKIAWPARRDITLHFYCVQLCLRFALLLSSPGAGKTRC